MKWMLGLWASLLMAVSPLVLARDCAGSNQHGCAKAGALKILFIGNSLTYYNQLPSLAAELYRRATPGAVEVEMLARAGAKLRDHLDAGEVQHVLAARHFDVVVFQELGGFPACPPTFPGCGDSPQAVEDMTKLIRASGARAIWFSTWQSSPEGQALLTEMAAALAAKLQIEVADVGAALKQYSLANPQTSPLRSDGHPQPLGSWIAAAAIVSTIKPQATFANTAEKVCDVDWTSHGPELTSLASAQKQPEGKCVEISAQELRGVLHAVEAAHTRNKR